MYSPFIWAVITLIIGLGVGAFVISSLTGKKSQEANATLVEAQRRISEQDSDLAKKQKELQLEAREEVQREVTRLREIIEKETAERRQELKDAEARLRERENGIERRIKSLEGRERGIVQKEADAQRKVEEAGELVLRQKEALEKVAGLSTVEAKDLLLERVAEEASAAMSHVAHRIEEEAREKAEEKARKIIAMAIQRCAVDQTSETAVSVVPLPSEDLKGRIIGREGRNIRTFEQLSGADLIIDDTPEAVVVSCFDPVRREVARIALGNLVNDGRIHPARIEEMLLPMIFSPRCQLRW